MDMRGLAERANASWDEVVEFLDSPPGRRLRRMIATGVIVSAPLLIRLPGLRRSAVGRLIELAGGATLVVKLAEWVRDWERDRATPLVT
jgi:hypothetical protein